MLLSELIQEVKGVRRVRTPAGVRFYGKPIGTIITRGMRDAAVARRRNRDRPSGSSGQRNRPARGVQRSGAGDDGSDSPSLRQLGATPRRNETSESTTPPVRRARKTPAKKAAPSKATREHIDQVRSAYDGGSFDFWNEQQGVTRGVDEAADEQADKYDADAKELQRLIDLDEESADNGNDTPDWVIDRMDELTKKLNDKRATVEELNRLADLGRDLTADDIDMDKLSGYSMSNVIAYMAKEDGKDVKRLMANYFNNKKVQGERDKKYRLKPSQAVMDARDDMAELGKSMLTEIRSAYDSDPDVKAARDKRTKMDAEAPPRYENFRKPNGAPDFPAFDRAYAKWNKDFDESHKGMSDHDVLVWQADFWREYADVNREEAVAQRRVKLAYLNSIRPMGPHPDANFKFKDWAPDGTQGLSGGVYGPSEGRGEAEYDKMMHDALEIYPTSWIAAWPDQKYKRGWTARAFHSGPPPGTDPEANTSGLIALHAPGDGSNRNYDGAFPDYNTEVAAHELGHGMETWIPGLTTLEWAENYNRSGRNLPDGDWEVPRRITGAGENEVAMDDNWQHHYAGKVYSARAIEHADHHELFTTAIQDTFGRTAAKRQFSKPDDDNAEAMVLAMMATLNYYDDEEDWRKK